MPATCQARRHLQPLCCSWASNVLVEQSSAKYQQAFEGQEVLKLQGLGVGGTGCQARHDTVCGPPDPSVPAATSASVAERSGLLLTDLPLEVVELICQQLPLEDRMALACCCRQLWAHPRMASSPAFWGNMRVAPRRLSHAGPLVAFLVRRRAGLRRVRLELGGSRESLAAALLALAGSAVVLLEVFAPRGPGNSIRATLPSLLFLRCLRSLDLSSCRLQSLPAGVLPGQLVALNLSRNRWLGVGQLASLPLLAKLTALTWLSLSDCGLEAVPEQLSCMHSLAWLDISHNHRLGDAAMEGSAPWFQPLQCLTALTSLHCRSNELCLVPAPLSALRALVHLNLSRNPLMGVNSGELRALVHLSRLRSLSLSGCLLAALPQQLSALPALAELDLSSNPHLSSATAGSEHGLDQLLQLPALTRLDLSSCSLRALPQQLGGLTQLADLSLWGNHGLGEQAGALGTLQLDPLRQLSCLTGLDLGSCSFKEVPPQLSALAGSLAYLRLRSNELHAINSLRRLAALTCLTRLDISESCGLKVCPPRRSPLHLLPLPRLPMSGSWLAGKQATGVPGHPRVLQQRERLKGRSAVGLSARHSRRSRQAAPAQQSSFTIGSSSGAACGEPSAMVSVSCGSASAWQGLAFGHAKVATTAPGESEGTSSTPSVFTTSASNTVATSEADFVFGAELQGGRALALRRRAANRKG